MVPHVGGPCSCHLSLTSPVLGWGMEGKGQA